MTFVYKASFSLHEPFHSMYCIIKIDDGSYTLYLNTIMLFSADEQFVLQLIAQLFMFSTTIQIYLNKIDESSDC